MRPRNKKIFSTDQQYLVTLREEYISIGFHTSLEAGVLTVYTTKPKKAKKKKEERRPRRDEE